MDEVLLVRHAATRWTGRRYCGQGDPPLSEAGRAAAARLAADLGPTLQDGIRIVSSPLLRARQTATAIARVVPHAPLEIDDRWSETNVGVAEGLTHDELAMVAPTLAARLAVGETAIDWPEGESAESFLARVEAAWRDLDTHPGPVLVVSHGGPLRIAIALATNRAPDDVRIPDPGGVWRLPAP